MEPTLCFGQTSGSWVRVSDLAPRLFAILPKRIVNNRSVLEALTNRKWISDIKGTLSVGAIVDYLQLWDFLS
jgi:hypothetical protein